MAACGEFAFDADELGRRLAAARAPAAAAAARRRWQEIRSGASCDSSDLAALWNADIDTGEFYDLAAARQRAVTTRETFSPLYLTNTCDAECRMCGMRRNNRALTRETADDAVVADQLATLRRRGMHAVALLTGEYRPELRPWAMAYVNRALRTAVRLEFRHILINVGSIDAREFEQLLDGVAMSDGFAGVSKLTMSTFQETYDRRCYERFMGTDPDNPRAGFERRLANFDRAHAAGLRVANPGILVGLNPDIDFEITALALHTEHLSRRGMEVYLSMPRLRRIAGEGDHHTIGDDEYVRLVALLSLALPAAKPVITTRESAAMQARLAPIVTVISAGSASVAPYTGDGARFPLESSQFEVIDQRPFEAILQDHRARGLEFENFVPSA